MNNCTFGKEQQQQIAIRPHLKFKVYGNRLFLMKKKKIVCKVQMNIKQIQALRCFIGETRKYVNSLHKLGWMTDYKYCFISRTCE